MHIEEDLMVVGARQTEIGDLLGFSHLTMSRVYRWFEKGTMSSEWSFCGQKYFVDARGQIQISDNSETPCTHYIKV